MSTNNSQIEAENKFLERAMARYEHIVKQNLGIEVDVCLLEIQIASYLQRERHAKSD